MKGQLNSGNSRIILQSLSNILEEVKHELSYMEAIWLISTVESMLKNIGISIKIEYILPPTDLQLVEA